MDVVAESGWSWMLFEDDGRYVLILLFGGIALYEMIIELQPDEVALVRAGGHDAVEGLRRRVIDAPQDFRARHLAGFNREPGVAEAIRRWRAAHDPVQSTDADR